MEKLEFDNDSWIQHVEYDPETSQMRITMKGGQKSVYECQDVPRDVYDAFKSAPSRGSFFNQNIKGNYTHKWFDSEE